VGSEIFMPNKKKTTPPPDPGHLWRLHHTAELLKWYGAGATGPFPECMAKQPSPEERETIVAELDRITAGFVLPGLLPEGGDLHIFTTNAEADQAQRSQGRKGDERQLLQGRGGQLRLEL
jgi:hypothetical protein